MTEHSTEQASPEWPHPTSDAARVAGSFAPGAPYPDPYVPSGSTTWIEGTDRGRVESADGTSTWGVPDPPAAVPDPIPGAEGPHTVPGWLTRSRGDRPDSAA